MNVGRDAFKIRLCEQLFGCHVIPAVTEDLERIFECACCEERIDIHAWVHAKHAEDCIINDVRDYLSMHKPECVRSHGKDWVRA